MIIKVHVLTARLKQIPIEQLIFDVLKRFYLGTNYNKMYNPDQKTNSNRSRNLLFADMLFH